MCSRNIKFSYFKHVLQCILSAFLLYFRISPSCFPASNWITIQPKRRWRSKCVTREACKRITLSLEVVVWLIQAVFYYLHFVFFVWIRKMRSCGVVVITSASHAEGRRFEPGQDLRVRLFSSCTWSLQHFFNSWNVFKAYSACLHRIKKVQILIQLCWRTIVNKPTFSFFFFGIMQSIWPLLNMLN